MTFELAKEYKFNDWGVEAAYNEMKFLGALVSLRWISNQYQLIVWKIASLIRRYPTQLGVNLWSKNEVMDQLRKKYTIEFVEGRHSCIRKLCEHDSFPFIPMILCVTFVNIQNSTIGATDGAYHLVCKLDHYLTNCLREKKIFSGQKLFICGAQMDHFEPVHPLSLPNDIYLRLSINCTRRAKCFAKMGQYVGIGKRISLSSIVPEGGIIPEIHVVISRVYPVLFKETLPDGSHRILTKVENEKEEENYFLTLENEINKKLHEKKRSDEFQRIANEFKRFYPILICREEGLEKMNIINEIQREVNEKLGARQVSSFYKIKVKL